MRICIVYDCLFPWTYGGAERWYRNLAEGLAERGMEVTFVTQRQWPRDVEATVSGVGVVTIGPRVEVDLHAVLVVRLRDLPVRRERRIGDADRQDQQIRLSLDAEPRAQLLRASPRCLAPTHLIVTVESVGAAEVGDRDLDPPHDATVIVGHLEFEVEIGRGRVERDVLRILVGDRELTGRCPVQRQCHAPGPGRCRHHGLDPQHRTGEVGQPGIDVEVVGLLCPGDRWAVAEWRGVFELTVRPVAPNHGERPVVEVAVEPATIGELHRIPILPRGREPLHDGNAVCLVLEQRHEGGVPHLAADEQHWEDVGDALRWSVGAADEQLRRPPHGYAAYRFAA
jgi:hypothetical protein